MKTWTIDEMLEYYNFNIEDAKYKLQRTKSPNNKRNLQNMINFHEANIKYYTELKNLKTIKS